MLVERVHKTGMLFKIFAGYAFHSYISYTYRPYFFSFSFPSIFSNLTQTEMYLLVCVRYTSKYSPVIVCHISNLL